MEYPLTPDPGYYKDYILKVPEGNVAAHLELQGVHTYYLIKSLPEEKGNFAYAEDKWSIKQLLGHMIDAERVFAYRAMRYARNDKTPLAAFEEDDYVRNAFFNEHTMHNLAEEYRAQRYATVTFFRNLNAVEKERTGTANNKILSVNQLLYIICGHELHHLGVLKARYGVEIP